MKSSSKKESIEEKEYFWQTYQLLYTNLKKFKYRLKNHPFEQTPKKLLNSFLLYKNGKSKDVLKTLESFNESNLFYKGVQYCLIGLAKNHIGKYSFSQEAFSTSIECFEEIDESNFILTSLVGLGFVYGNKKQTQEMGEVIKKLNHYSPDSEHMSLSKKHCNSLYFSLTGEYEKAQKIALDVLDDESEAASIYKPSFFVILFCLYFEESQFELCAQTLERYKSCKGFTIKPNYKYMKILLNHLMNNEKLYIYERDFTSCIELYHQLMVIKNKFEGNLDSAKEFWDILQKHNPELYADNFQYLGGASLFQANLQKYLYKEAPIFDIISIDKLDSPLEKLHFIFENSNAPVDKYLLLELIWDEYPSESALSKLRKLITSYRRKYDTEVSSIQNSYKVEKSDQVAS